MREIRRVEVARIHRDESQPRKRFDEPELLALGQNMLTYGQAIPVIVCDGVLVDGERRWRSAQLVGIKELDAIILATKPSATELALLQASLDVHRQSLKAMERSSLLARIRDENGWTVGELAQRLQMNQSAVSKFLSLQKLTPDLQAKVDAGELDLERAYIVSQAPDAAAQRELAAQAGKLSREQLRQRAKSRGTPAIEVKTSTARFALCPAVTVTVQGPQMSLGDVVEVLTDVLKEIRRGLSQGLTVESQQKVMKDKARAKA